MNLHGIVAGVIGAVNPNVDALLYVCTGRTTANDGTQSPTYDFSRKVRAQVQSLTQNDLRQVEALNLQDVQNTMYLYGNVSGVVRASNKGGDKIKLADGTWWLVTGVIEQWPDWVKVAVTMQTD